MIIDQVPSKLAICPTVFLSDFSLWICYETQLTNTKTKPSQTSQLSRARDGRGMGEVCLDKFLRTSSNCIKYYGEYGSFS